MRRLELYLSPEKQLVETLFYCPLQAKERRCIRGKSSGAYKNFGSFQWTKAVQGLTLLLAQSAFTSRAGTVGGPDLLGGRGSLAASLDDAISKNTNWLYEMFGSDHNGELVIRRLVLRTNSGRKRAGPVGLSLNTKFLEAASVKFFSERREILTPADLANICVNLKRGSLLLAA